MDFLPKAYAGAIVKDSARESVVMTLGTRKATNLSGTSIQTFSVPSVADWVAVAGTKPAVSATNTVVEVQTHKLAAIVTVTDELKEQGGAELANHIRNEVTGQFSRLLDDEVLFGTSSLATWTNAVNDTDNRVTIDPNDVYGSLVAAMEKTRDRSALWAFSPEVEYLLLNSLDNTGRPLFLDPASGGVGVLSGGRLLGRPLAWSDNVYLDGGDEDPSVVGFFGTWKNNVIWGIHNKIAYKSTDVGTATTGNAFTQNLTHYRVEARFAAFVLDPKQFTALEVAAEDGGDGGDDGPENGGGNDD